MSDLRYIVVHLDDEEHPAYHSSEPEPLRGERDGYAGGFSYEISEAIVHFNPILAHLERSRMEKIYDDVPGAWVVKTMTAKELFKARLGG